MNQQQANTGFVNIYRDELCRCFHASGVFESEDAAKKAAGEGCVATVPVKWEEPTKH